MKNGVNLLEKEKYENAKKYLKSKQGGKTEM